MSSTLLPRLPGIIFPSDYGPKEAATLNTVFAEIGNEPATVILDAGTWDIKVQVNVPSQITLMLLRGAIFILNATLDLGECELQAPPNAIFTGFGALAGTPSFAFRHPEWGNLVTYNIGEGYIGADVDISDYIASPADIKNGVLDNLVISPKGLRSTVLHASQLPSHDNLSNVASDQHRRIHVSAGVPTGGQDGDIWLQYS